MALYHFTCDRAAKLIVASGLLQPAPQIELGGLPVVWLTSLRHRDKQLARRLGLGWHTTRPDCAQEYPPCNPLAVRFSVLADDLSPFIRFEDLMRDHPNAEQLYRARPGATPGRWFASLAPIRLQLLTNVIPRQRTPHD